MRSATLISDLVYHCVCESSAAGWPTVVVVSVGCALRGWRGQGSTSDCQGGFLACRVWHSLLDLGVDHGAGRCAVGVVMCECLIKRVGLFALRNAYVPSATERVHAQLQFCGACKMCGICAGRASDVAAGARVWELAP